MQLFVPGRVCLFGEHSDWAGGYRAVDPTIEPGETIITGTNQGIHATVRPHPDRLILHATTPAGDRLGPFESPMSAEALKEAAQAAGFFSYTAGVAYQMLTRHEVRGLEIDNHLTDLPIRKGLSSSAAICVLVARAFGRAYDLGLTVRDEMELAYLGETTTPSRCGRMDQGCAFGSRPVRMTFDGDRLECEDLLLAGIDLHIVVVDLGASKDTRLILDRLNACYPEAATDVARDVREYLGPMNRRIVGAAASAIEAGDARRVGELMIEAQAAFDRHVAPACPEQLTAPVLHRVLADPALAPHIWGGKGVGSQGDGTAQLVARSKADQARAIELLAARHDMHGMALDIGAGA